MRTFATRFDLYLLHVMSSTVKENLGLTCARPGKATPTPAIASAWSTEAIVVILFASPSSKHPSLCSIFLPCQQQELQHKVDPNGGCLIRFYYDENDEEFIENPLRAPWPLPRRTTQAWLRSLSDRLAIDHPRDRLVIAIIDRDRLAIDHTAFYFNL